MHTTSERRIHTGCGVFDSEETMLDPWYDSLDRLPPREQFARMDGTGFIVLRHDLGMFETRTLLCEAGIPDGYACHDFHE